MTHLQQSIHCRVVLDHRAGGTLYRRPVHNRHFRDIKHKVRGYLLYFQQNSATARLDINIFVHLNKSHVWVIQCITLFL